jgi:hypothetical protein
MIVSKELPPCDADVFSHGRAIFVTHTVPCAEIENWVRAVAKLSGQRVDWSYYGGRAVVRYLGSELAVREAIEYLLPILQDKYRAAVISFGARSDPKEMCGYFYVSQESECLKD